MLIFKALHILSMFVMVTIEIGAEFLYAFAISRRDVRALASIHRLLEQSRAGIASIGALVSGVVFGVLTAATGGLDFFDGWLIAAYVLVAVFLITTTRALKTMLPLGAKAVEAAAGQRPAEDVVQDMSGNRALAWFALDAVVVAAFILDMVLKPF